MPFQFGRITAHLLMATSYCTSGSLWLVPVHSCCVIERVLGLLEIHPRKRCAKTAATTILFGVI